jgi:tetratricopeptide (TPR) repeat protein
MWAGLAMVVSCAMLPACSHKPKPNQEESALLADLVDSRAGLQLLKDGRVEEAIQLLTRARQTRPQDALVPNALGLAYLYKKDPTAAVKAFSDALKIDPGFGEARNNRGVAYMELGRLDEASADFDKVLEGAPSPERLNARYNLGVLRRKEGRMEDAERELSLVIADDPLYVKALRERGLVREKRGEYTAALKDFLEVLKSEPKDGVSSYEAALCLLTTGRRDLAVRYMERTVAVAPDSEEGKRARRFLDAEPPPPPPGGTP